MTACTPSRHSKSSRIQPSALPAVLCLLAAAMVGSTVRAADAPPPGQRAGIPDFSAPVEVRQFDAPGFARKAVGVIYDAATVKQGVPLGGIGTGYLDSWRVFSTAAHHDILLIQVRWLGPRRQAKACRAEATT